jgi:hypothetical protein
MLRNPLEVAQGAKRPYLGFIVLVPGNVQGIPTFYYYFVGVHMIVVFRNFGVGMEGGKKCHQAKSLKNMN